MERLEPKKSRKTIGDCIEYIRSKMYEIGSKEKKTKRDHESDDESESGDVLPSLSKRPKRSNVVPTNVVPTNGMNETQMGKSSDRTSEVTESNEGNEGDNDVPANNEDENDDESIESIGIPANYMFP